MPAFFLAMQDTLVVDDMDNARRCAFQQAKRHRVVTLDGAVINPSGEMQGYAQTIRGRMKLSGQADASDVEADKQRIDNELTELRQKKRSAMDTLHNITNEKVGSGRELDEANRRMELAKDEAENMQKKIQDLDNARSDGSNLATDQEIQEMKQLEEKHQQVLDKVKKLHDSKKEKISEIEK